MAKATYVCPACGKPSDPRGEFEQQFAASGPAAEDDVQRVIRELSDQLRSVLSALHEIAALSDKPSDFDGWYDTFGDYADCDTSNMGDVHAHGADMGRWQAAKIARSALAQSAERATGDENA